MISETKSQFPIRKCKDYERLWKGRCIDKNLKDEWLENLNSLKVLEMVSICEGHSDMQRNYHSSNPHINFRIKEPYVRFYSSKSNDYLKTFSNFLENLIDKSDTSYRVTYKNSFLNNYNTKNNQYECTFNFHKVPPTAPNCPICDKILWFNNMIFISEKLDLFLSNLIPDLAKKKIILAEDLTFWYLRLNGFLSIQNFVVHPDFDLGQMTDIDLIGIRFPYRNELPFNPDFMNDDRLLCKDKPFIVLTEVKKDVCNINQTWLREDFRNLRRILAAIGTHSQIDVDNIIQSLVNKGNYEDEYYCISFLFVGRRNNIELTKRFPNSLQILYNEIFSFIYHRFKKYRKQKYLHPQWNMWGKLLWNESFISLSAQEFINKFIIVDRF